jgi:hypothetical protein
MVLAFWTDLPLITPTIWNFSLSFDNSKQIISYKVLLEKIINDKSPTDIINKLIQIVMNLDSNKFIYKTMRMTAIS